MGIRLEPAKRNEFHPGELVTVVVKCRFDEPQDKPRKLPLAGLENSTRLHLETPEGHEFIWDPDHDYEEQSKANQAITAADWTDWQGPAVWRITFRLSNSKRNWIDVKTKKPAELSLANSESFYRLWAECNVVAGKKAPAGAWSGNVRTGEAIMGKVTDLPIAKRNMKLTEEQQTLVKQWLALQLDETKKSKSVSRFDPLETWLRDALALTENEGLAQRFVEIAKTDPKNSDAAFGLLLARTGTMNDGDAGIDGPYLKELAQYALGVNEGKYERTQSRPPLTMFGIPQAVVYLGYHPEDRPMREGAVNLLKQVCHLYADQKIAIPRETIVCRFGVYCVASARSIGFVEK